MKLLILALVMWGASPIYSENRKPTLFVLDPSKKNCDWVKMTVPSLEETIVNSTPQCPKHILFEKDYSRAWYFMGRDVLESRLNGKHENQRLGGIDFDQSSIVDVFRDKKTGELWVVGLDNAVKPKPNTGGKILLFEGREYRSFPLSWGSQAIAYVKALRAGKWVLIAAAATRTEADDTPGISVVSAHIKRAPEAVSMRSILEAATCVAQKCADRFPTHWNAAGVAARIGAALSKSSKVGFFPIDENEAIVAQAQIDASVHLFSPAVYCKRKCSEIHSIRPSPGGAPRISVELNGDFALVTDESAGTHPVLVTFDRSKGDQLLPDDSLAFWMR